MRLQSLVRAPGALRFASVSLAVTAIAAAAASGLVYDSPYAPLVVGVVIAVPAVLIALLRKPVWALYAALFVVMLPGGLLPATIQSNLNRGLTVIAFSVWLVSVLARRCRIAWTITASFMCGFVVWGVVTLLWAGNLSAGFNSIQVYTLRLVLYLVLVANLIRSEESLDGLMKTLAISGWVLILIGLGTLVLAGYTSGSRFRILEMNENETGILALVTLPGVLWLAIRSSGRQRAVRDAPRFRIRGRRSRPGGAKWIARERHYLFDHAVGFLDLAVHTTVGDPGPGPVGGDGCQHAGDVLDPQRSVSR